MPGEGVDSVLGMQRGHLGRRQERGADTLMVGNHREPVPGAHPEGAGQLVGPETGKIAG